MQDKLTLQQVRVAFGDGTEGPFFTGYDIGGWNGFWVVALPLPELVRFYQAAADLGELDEEGRPVYSYELQPEGRDHAVTLWETVNDASISETLHPVFCVDGVPFYSTGGGWALVPFVGGDGLTL